MMVLLLLMKLLFFYYKNLFWNIRRNFYELFFIVFVPIHIIMQHETATIKKIVKRYTTKKDGDKESISYTAKFTADSIFEDGDIVAVLPIDEFNNLSDATNDDVDNLRNIIADKDVAIGNLNESNAKLKAELDDKFNLINDVTAKLKASEKIVAELESNISANTKTLAELESDIKVADATIKNLENDVAKKDAELHSLKESASGKDKDIAELSAENKSLLLKLNELTDLLSEKDATITELDERIVDYKVEVAKYDAVDIDDLKNKAKDSDKANKIIIRLQNEIKEYVLLVKHKDKENDALERKGVLDIIFNKDVTADIDAPELTLIDLSGNPITDNDNGDDEIAISGKATDNDDADSGKDTLTII